VIVGAGGAFVSVFPAGATDVWVWVDETEILEDTLTENDLEDEDDEADEDDEDIEDAQEDEDDEGGEDVELWLEVLDVELIAELDDMVDERELVVEVVVVDDETVALVLDDAL
jgi:hypothetical protein